MVSHVQSEQPVVRAVLEQIPHGHGSVRESVDKQGLEDALSIVC